MKRLSSEQRLYLIRRSRRIEKLRVKKNRRRKLGRRWTPGFTRLRAPEVFSLEHVARKSLLEFLGDLRTSLLKDHIPTLIDFSNTRKMVAGGTLLFVAELSSCMETAAGAVRVRCIPPRNVKVAQVLKQIGVFDLLMYRRKIEPKFKDVVHWRYACGHQVEGEKYESILGSYEGRVADPLLSSLFRGISEAMTNCHHHAYIATRPDGLNIAPTEKRWWMFSQERDGYLYVVFCDIGVGIPATLPVRKPKWWQRIVSLGKAGSDGEVIRAAVDTSMSRTGKHYRGKGLRQLLEAVQAYPDGAIRIFSNRGCYTFHKGNVAVRDYGDSIMGTLIQWKLPVIQQGLL